MKLVTVAIPVYRRFDLLPNVLRCVDRQDYPHVELLVSDNGVNGSRVPEIVRENYSRPFRFRGNPVTVPMVAHFNQLPREASGQYFVMLCDDDEISPNYISDLVGILDSDPRISAAFGHEEIVDFSGHILHTSSADVPPLMTGDEFIRAWCTYRYRFGTWVTFLGRTQNIRDLGGMPEFTYGTHSDDGLLVKLSLGRLIAFSQGSTFRKRKYSESAGRSMSCLNLADDTRKFLRFLETDPCVREFSKTQPRQWAESKDLLIKMTWETYAGRLNTMYREQLSGIRWLRAAFAMPFIPSYYRQVLRAMLGGLRPSA
jgi:glycosyltransferase involved in cell wall biosynthesis